MDICEDIDECEKGTHKCDFIETCENTRGSYLCHCKSGYRKSNPKRKRCLGELASAFNLIIFLILKLFIADIDECAEKIDQCQGQCDNTRGGYTCICGHNERLNDDGLTCSKL